MSAVSNFAGSSLLHQGGNYEPQRKSNFAVVIYGLADTDTLVLSLAKATIPDVQIVEGKIKYFNETMKYAGSVSPFPDGELSFTDYIDRSTLTTLSKWMKQVWNPATGAIGWASTYKKTGDIMLLPPGMPGNTPGAVSSTAYNQRVWRLGGVWIKGLKYDPLDHSDDGSTPAMVNVTLCVDRCIPAFMG
jgi:hypothetical protein